jgi:hypothetical protein
MVVLRNVEEWWRGLAPGSWGGGLLCEPGVGVVLKSWFVKCGLIALFRW